MTMGLLVPMVGGWVAVRGWMERWVFGGLILRFKMRVMVVEEDEGDAFLQRK